MFASWNETYHCLMDEMQFPIGHTDCKALLEALQEHLKKSPAELAEIANDRLKKSYPKQYEISPFTEEHFK